MSDRATQRPYFSAACSCYFSAACSCYSSAACSCYFSADCSCYFSAAGSCYFSAGSSCYFSATCSCYFSAACSCYFSAGSLLLHHLPSPAPPPTPLAPALPTTARWSERASERWNKLSHTGRFPLMGWWGIAKRMEYQFCDILLDFDALTNV